MLFFFFFFNDTATTEIYTLSLHDALPISEVGPARCGGDRPVAATRLAVAHETVRLVQEAAAIDGLRRPSSRVHEAVRGGQGRHHFAAAHGHRTGHGRDRSGVRLDAALVAHGGEPADAVHDIVRIAREGGEGGEGGKDGTRPTHAAPPRRRPHAAGPRPDPAAPAPTGRRCRSEEHTSELQSLAYLVCRLLLEKKKKRAKSMTRDIKHGQSDERA